jgi:hypothetical protein
MLICSADAKSRILHGQALFYTVSRARQNELTFCSTLFERGNEYESFFCKSAARVTVAFQDEIALPKLSHAAESGRIARLQQLLLTL